MTILSRLIGAYGKLPPAETHNILIERDLPVPMPDGAILLANRYAPPVCTQPQAALLRIPQAPYSRRRPSGRYP
jgi:predicted acyl esterase